MELLFTSTLDSQYVFLFRRNSAPTPHIIGYWMQLMKMVNIHQESSSLTSTTSRFFLLFFFHFFFISNLYVDDVRACEMWEYSSRQFTVNESPLNTHICIRLEQIMFVVAYFVPTRRPIRWRMRVLTYFGKILISSYCHHQTLDTYTFNKSDKMYRVYGTFWIAWPRFTRVSFDISAKAFTI